MAAVLTEALVRSWMPERPVDGHKGTFGRVNILAGCEGFTGAPALASRAAVRGGAGLVFLQVPRCVYPIVAVKCDEAMPSPIADQNGKVAYAAMKTVLERSESCDAVLIGPGLGRSEESDGLVCALAGQITRPLVLDADGLNAVSAHINVLSARAAPAILTPHDGEFHRLTGHWPGEDREEEACALARNAGCIVVLKGHRTMIASPEGETFLNTTGNAGMAKGGSGDVLAGLTVSFLAQGMEPVRAAAAAVWVHGRAGDLCKRAYGERYMTPVDLIAKLAVVLKALE